MQPETAAIYRPRFFAFREQEDNLENQFTQDTPFTELEQLRMKVTLTSCAHPEYGEVTIPFPIPDEDYDHTMELLRGLDIGDTLAQDCQIVRVESQYPILTQLEGTMVNVDELDYLARRMNCLYGDEETQFFAMAHKMKLSDIKDFIDLASCCQKATVITDFSDLEKIGWDHFRNVTDGDMRSEEYKLWDGREAALALIESGQGTVTPYGVVYDNGMVLEQHYGGQEFPAFPDGSRFLALEIMPDGDFAFHPPHLYLPAPMQQIERMMHRAGIDDLSDAHMLLDYHDLPEKVAEALHLKFLRGGEIPELNRMCQAIEPLQRADREKLNAVVQLAEPQNAYEICQLAENLDQFDFVPKVHTPEEYGKYMIQQSGHFEFDENLADFYDYRRYGEQRVQQEGGGFTARGYVSYHGTLTLDELMREEPAEEQGMQMSGM